jgi:type IV secretory pathway TraG/TraD family ATPase VirD4
LPVPLVGVLDECANICPWPELPEIYSYYGSCGVILCSLFQNVSQGYIAFGKEGFKSLFDNANTKIYLGGNSDTEFLQQLSSLVGSYDKLTHSVNDNQGFVHTEQRSLKQEQIFTPQQLAEWPFGRALVLSSQNRATIAKTIPWFQDKELKQKIDSSLKMAKEQTVSNFDLPALKQKHSSISEQSESRQEKATTIESNSIQLSSATTAYIDGLKKGRGEQ